MNNGMRHSQDKHIEAKAFRKRGFTHREIAQQLGVSVGIAYLWTKGVVVTKRQKEDIERRRVAVFQSKFAAYSHENQDAIKKRIAKSLGPYQYKPKYNREDLLKSIRDFYTTHKRIPLKRERGSRIYRIRFGTWNNAIREAGFDPNPELFAKKFTARDGHSCDSFSEKIIDDWLFSQGIAHERSFAYKGTRMTADFLLPPHTIIEFFGLAGVQKKYDKLIQRKRKLAMKLKLRLIEMYPKDLQALAE